MKKYKKWVMWGSLLAAFVLMLVFYIYGSQKIPEKEKRENYSVILYQRTENEWQLLSEGIRQAERDFGVNVNLVTMAKDAGAEEQKDLIEREIQNGAEGVGVAVVDSGSLKEELLKIAEDIPVVTLETGVGEEIPHISADDYRMGFSLGEKILEDWQKDEVCHVTVVREYMERDSVENRYRGLKDALEQEGERVQVKDCVRGDGDYDLALYLKKHMAERHQDVMVALDKNCLEKSVEAYQLLEQEETKADTFPVIYGIGNTEKTVGWLDNGKIRAFVYQNEFHVGYQGMEMLIRKKRGQKREKAYSVRQYLAEKSTLYETENQRLLFPIH